MHFKLACEWNLPKIWSLEFPATVLLAKNHLRPHYSNKVLKCVTVKIHSDIKPQHFDAPYKHQLNQVGSAKSDQSDSFSWQQRSRFEASVIYEKQGSLITKEGYTTLKYFVIGTTCPD